MQLLCSLKYDNYQLEPTKLTSIIIYNRSQFHKYIWYNDLYRQWNTRLDNKINLFCMCYSNIDTSVKKVEASCCVSFTAADWWITNEHSNDHFCYLPPRRTQSKPPSCCDEDISGCVPGGDGSPPCLSMADSPEDEKGEHYPLLRLACESHDGCHASLTSYTLHHCVRDAKINSPHSTASLAGRGRQNHNK